MEFRKIHKEDILRLKEYVYDLDTINSNYSLAFLEMWADYLQTQISFDNDYIFIRETLTEELTGYFLPLNDNYYKGVKLLEKYVLDHSIYPLIIINTDDKHILELEKIYPHGSSFYFRDDSDYTYNFQDLLELKGKKYSAKRHLLKYFKETYLDVSFKKIEDQDHLLIKEFIKDFRGEKENLTEEGIYEEEKAIELMDNFHFYNLEGIIVFDKEKVIGVAYGEILNGVFYEHVEKGLREYEGIYIYIINSLASFYPNLILCREDDAGDLGLRKSKLSLHPLKIVNHPLFIAFSNFDFLFKVPKLQLDEEYYLEELKEEDKDAYYYLNIDNELNKYYELNYYVDLNNPLITKEYFYQMVIDDFKHKEAISFMLKRKGLLIGEVIIHNIDYQNSAEIGFRIIKEYQNKGLAFKSAMKVLEFLFLTLKISSIKAKVIKGNIGSQKVIEKLGFGYLESDDIYHYYSKINNL